MSDVARRNVPALPGASRFPELNVRTYVEFDGRAGVWFFSLDAANRLAVWVARWLFHLPYTHARMRVRRVGEQIRYESVRSSGHSFEATYTPQGSAERTAAGSLAHWFTERYCLYAQSRSGELFRTDIDHEPWPLQSVATDVTRNDMLGLHGMSVGGPAPQQHYARKLRVVVWPLERVSGAAAG